MLLCTKQVQLLDVFQLLEQIGLNMVEEKVVTIIFNRNQLGPPSQWPWNFGNKFESSKAKDLMKVNMPFFLVNSSNLTTRLNGDYGCISNNGNKGILNKYIPIQFIGWSYMQHVKPWTFTWGRPNVICKVEKMFGWIYKMMGWLGVWKAMHLNPCLCKISNECDEDPNTC